MGHGRIVLLAAALACGGAAAAQPTRQQSYDAAQAAFDRGDWTTAAAGFEPLLNAPGKASRSDGLIRARYAEALSYLGRDDEAEEEGARAVGEFTGAGQDDLRAEAYLTLAADRFRAFDLEGAVAAYKLARTAATPGFPLRSELDLGETGAAMTVVPQHAYDLATAMMADPAFKARPKIEQAQIVTLAARAKLNAGDLPGALALSRQAIGQVGMTTNGVNIVQAQVRGDAALIYLKLDRPDDAREALAYSGGGYMPKSDWLHKDNDLPVCDDDMRPDDVAVIQFGVLDTGAVAGVIPIYTNRPGGTGAAFARAVRQWSFDPQDVKGLAPFWRYGIRMELRCVTRPPSTQLEEPFDTEANEWLTSQGAIVDKRGIVVPPGSRLHAPLLATLPPRRQHAGSNLVTGWDQMIPLLPGLAAPTDVRVLAGYRAIGYHGSSISGSAGRRAEDLRKLADQARSLPGSQRATAWIELETAIQLETAGNFAGARPYLEQVLATPQAAVEADDPIRLVATLHRALVDRKLGDAAAADSRLTRSGVSSEQCSLFDVKPLPVNRQVSANDFPAEVYRWRMQGFAREAFDIGADGRVTSARTVLAYPAFVFGDGTRHTVSRFRYLPPTFNNVALGCASHTETFKYVVPDR